MSRPTIQRLQGFPDHVRLSPVNGGLASQQYASGPVVAADPRPDAELTVRLVLPQLANLTFDNGRVWQDTAFTAPRTSSYLEVNWRLLSPGPPDEQKFILNVYLYYADSAGLNDVRPKLIWKVT